MTRSPVKKRRTGKPRRGPERNRQYLDFIRSLGCIICRDRSAVQRTVTETAHVGERGLGQKCSDYETVPLCAGCHRIGPHAQHVLGARFWEHHGMEKSKVIGALNAVFEIEFGSGA